MATWLVAFNACYYALRGERVAVVAPICSPDPLWTALLAWLIAGAAFGGATLAGMAVAMASVVLALDGRGRRSPGRRARRRGALAAATHGDVLPAATPGTSGGGTTPVFSIVLGAVFLREWPGVRLTLAAVVTVAGVLIATLDSLA